MSTKTKTLYRRFAIYILCFIFLQDIQPVYSEYSTLSPPSQVSKLFSIEEFDNMLSSAKVLEEYINSGRIKQLVPEWEQWVALEKNPAFMEYHHISPAEHILLAFKHMESDFDVVIDYFGLDSTNKKILRRALFLHDFGKITVVHGDPEYKYSSHIRHARESEKIAGTILKRFGLRDEEIEAELFLVRHHDVLKDLAQYGHCEMGIQAFLSRLKKKDIWHLRLLTLHQLIDAASVRHVFRNSLSEGLENRLWEIHRNLSFLLPDPSFPSELEEEKLQELMKKLENYKKQYRTIKNKFKQLKRAIKDKKIQMNQHYLENAFLAMYRAHLDAMRWDGHTPYVIHCIETAIILVDELGEKDPRIILAALLHDILEDTKTTPSALKNIFKDNPEFGEYVTKLVRLMTKPPFEQFSDKNAQEIAFFHNLIYGTPEIQEEDIKKAAQKIKVADRIQNLRSSDTRNKYKFKNTINKTYTRFIYYFIGASNIPTAFKQYFLEVFIRIGSSQGMLTESQIDWLKQLSRKVLDYSLPSLEKIHDPFKYINDLIDEKQRDGSGPVVLAFDGMSGAGKSTVSGQLHDYLKSTGKKVVHIDANDYLKSRRFRDVVLEIAVRLKREYTLQREELYDFKRFQTEVLDVIKNFRESKGQKIEISRRRLYNRVSGRCNKNSNLTIDKNTVVIIEGIHVLQEQLLPYYDFTFLLFAPKETCLQNVINREKSKSKKRRQSGKKVKNRFDYIDWPSYMAHLIEYWINSRFVIDISYPGELQLEQNRYSRYAKTSPLTVPAIDEPEAAI